MGEDQKRVVVGTVWVIEDLGWEDGGWDVRTLLSGFGFGFCIVGSWHR